MRQAATEKPPRGFVSGLLVLNFLLAPAVLALLLAVTPAPDALLFTAALRAGWIPAVLALAVVLLPLLLAWVLQGFWTTAHRAQKYAEAGMVPLMLAVLFLTAAAHTHSLAGEWASLAPLVPVYAVFALLTGVLAWWGSRHLLRPAAHPDRLALTFSAVTPQCTGSTSPCAGAQCLSSERRHTGCYPHAHRRSYPNPGRTTGHDRHGCTFSSKKKPGTRPEIREVPGLQLLAGKRLPHKVDSNGRDDSEQSPASQPGLKLGCLDVFTVSKLLGRVHRRQISWISSLWFTFRHGQTLAPTGGHHQPHHN